MAERSGRDAPQANPTEFAILGLLAESPRSGYDIKKEVEGRLSHFWAESYGQIYPMLRRLHTRGLVDKEVREQIGRPDRHVYQITEAGRRQLAAWFESPPAESTRTRNELLLRIFLGRHAQPEQLARDVALFRARIEQQQAVLETTRSQITAEVRDHPDRQYWDIVIDYGLTVFDAMANWARRTEAKLDGGDQP